MKTKALTVRLPIKLREQYINIAIEKSNAEKRIITLSEVIINALEANLKQ